jgi:predicted transcriptional regulator
MFLQRQKITIIRYTRPARSDVNYLLKWLGDSLGLFNMRDKDKSCFRIFIELLKGAKQNTPLTSDEIAEQSGLSRGTVIHHLNKLIQAGMVVHHKNTYLLRVDRLELLIDEISKDLERTLDSLREVAALIDNELNL